MTLHVEATARRRLATYDKNSCPQCQAWLLAPTWSEYFNERCVRHTWACDTCGYEFETAVVFAAPEAVGA
jgi:rubredoxin